MTISSYALLSRLTVGCALTPWRAVWCWFKGYVSSLEELLLPITRICGDDTWDQSWSRNPTEMLKYSRSQVTRIPEVSQFYEWWMLCVKCLLSSLLHSLTSSDRTLIDSVFFFKKRFWNMEVALCFNVFPPHQRKCTIYIHI